MPLHFRSDKTHVVAPPTAGVRDRTQDAEIAIHSYLNDVDRRLSYLPADVRLEVRRELHCHLETLIAANEEIGADHEAAVSAALRKFGDTRTIARRFQNVWSRTGGDTVLEATYEALKIFGVMLVATFFLDGLQHIVLDPILRIHLGSNPASMIRATWMNMFLLLAPALAGLRFGLRYPRFASAGLLCGVGILMLATAPFVATMPSGAIGDKLVMHHPWIWHFDAARVLVEGLLGVWLLTSVSTAAFTGLVKRKLSGYASCYSLFSRG